MKPQERQQKILSLLKEKRGPMTGGELAERLGVTRQVIVQDIALLRAAGEEIIATPQGYLFLAGVHTAEGRFIITLACRHSPEETGEELLTIVENGGKVIDVVVEHPLYGELRGVLMLKTSRDVEGFMEKLNKTGAHLLSTLANGVHLHTVEVPDHKTEQIIRRELQEKGYMLPER